MTDVNLYLVTDPEIGGGRDAVPHIVAEAIRCGVDTVQLRDKDLPEADFLDRARTLREITGRAGVDLFVNDRLSVAAALGLHLHIGQSDTPYVTARRQLPEGLMIGLSIDSDAQLETVIDQAREAGVALPDVIGVGPVHPTRTKPDHSSPLGVSGVERIAARAREVGISSVAIGGVTTTDIEKLAATDVAGVCVVSAIMAAADPRAAAAELRDAWDCARARRQPGSTVRPSQPRTLSIAGTDPTGGAGIQADLKSIGAAGGYGMSVVTSLVAQNTHGVRSLHTPPMSFLTEQLAAVFEDVTVDAVKIGMLGSAEIVEIVAGWLDEHPVPVTVLDPVMIATSGDRLLDSDAEDAVKTLARQVDVVTPNLRELGVLCGTRTADNLDEAVRQAQEFARDNDTTVIVKGGHLRGPDADNAVVLPDGAVHHVSSPRINTSNTHGTGCSLSAALATRLGGGDDVNEALAWATKWLNGAIRHADALQVGSGSGPVDHFHHLHHLSRTADPRPWPHLSDVRLPEAADTTALQAGPAELIPASADAAPEPYIPAAGPWTRALWEATGTLWREITELPFIRGLASGTLPQDEFEFYLEQDAGYLREYSRALAGLSTRAPLPADQVAWAESAAECLVVEAELHRGRLDEGSGRAPSGPVTSAYTNFLKASVLGEDYVVGAATVLPCYWLYAEVGLTQAEQNHPGHPYHDWLSVYGGDDFVTGTRAAIERVERAFAAAAPAQRVAAARAYLSAAVHEREFFDQASRRRGF